MFRLSLHAYHSSFDSSIRSAIHSKTGPSDVGRLRPGDKRDQRSDLVDGAVAIQRSVCLLRGCPFAGSGIQICVDRTRLNVVDCDAPAPELSGQRLTKYLYGSLCRRVGHEARRHDTLAQTGTDRDDATATLHM